MDLTVAKKDLLRLVTRMQGVVERKSTMPVLSNILLDASDLGALKIAGTDLYLSISGSVRAEVKKAGTVAVPAKDLFERLKMMPDGPVHLTVGEHSQMIIKAMGVARRFTLRGLPGADFPPLPSPAEGSPSLTLDVDLLNELVARTSFSVSSDETRAHLNSALFEWAGETIRMVSTDGHRLTKMEMTATGRQATAKMLIPLKALRELQRLCDEALADVSKDAGRPTLRITQSGSSAFFDAGSMTFSAKLVDASFPPYDQVIPKSSLHKIRVPRAIFADALRAVSIAASERTGGVKLFLTKGALRITSESPESGDGFDEIPVEYKGPDSAFGFNAKYFLDVLGALDEEEVVFEVSNELDPAVVRPASDKSFLAVIMPMRI